MTVHISGSDLASIYVAGLTAGGTTMSAEEKRDDAERAIRHFLQVVESVDGRPPQVGDPMIWDNNSENMPRDPYGLATTKGSDRA